MGVLGFACLARLAMLLLSTEIGQLQNLATGGDAIGYTQLAHNLLMEHTFKFQDGGPTAYRMPGYPLFLVVASSIWQSSLPAQTLQIFIDMLSVLFVYKIGMSITGSVRTSLIAAGIIAVNPHIISLSVALLPETLSIFLITIAIYFLIRVQNSYWYCLWGAIALTFCIYLKPTTAPIAILLLVTSGIYWYFSHPIQWKTILRAFLPLITVGVLLTPWVARNLIVMQHFILLTTSSGSNLYGGNNSQADGGFISSEPYVLPAVSEVESNRIFKERAIHWITQNPVDFLRLLPAKAARFFWPLSFGTSGSISVPTVIFGVVLLVTIAYHAIVIYGIWILMVTNKYDWKALVLTENLIIVLLLSLVAFGAARFALPGFPASAIFVSIGIETIIHRSKKLFQKSPKLESWFSKHLVSQSVL